MSQSAESAPWTPRGSSTSRSGSHSVSRLWARAAFGANGAPPWKSGRTPALTGPGDSWAQGPARPSSPPPSLSPLASEPPAFLLTSPSATTDVRVVWWKCFAGLQEDETPLWWMISHDLSLSVLRAQEWKDWRLFLSEPIPMWRRLPALQRGLAPLSARLPEEWGWEWWRGERGGRRCSRRSVEAQKQGGVKQTHSMGDR